MFTGHLTRSKTLSFVSPVTRLYKVTPKNIQTYTNTKITIRNTTSNRYIFNSNSVFSSQYAPSTSRTLFSKANIGIFAASTATVVSAALIGNHFFGGRVEEDPLNQLLEWPEQQQQQQQQLHLLTESTTTNEQGYVRSVFEHSSREGIFDPVEFAKEQAKRHKELDIDDSNIEKITLYQYEVCPFCCKVKAFLDFHKVKYEVVEVEPIFKKQLKFSKEYKKVPIVVLERNNGEEKTVTESTEIISVVAQLIHDDSNWKVSDEEDKWRNWVDNTLVHTLPPNIYRNPTEAVQAFEYITTHGNFGGITRIFSKYTGALAMYLVSKKLKKKYNITNEREALYNAANEWMDAIGTERNFMGGEKPNLADLAVYGVLRSIEGLDAWHDLVENTKIGKWYGDVSKTIGMTARTNPIGE